MAAVEFLDSLICHPLLTSVVIALISLQISPSSGCCLIIIAASIAELSVHPALSVWIPLVPPSPTPPDIDVTKLSQTVGILSTILEFSGSRTWYKSIEFQKR